MLRMGPLMIGGNLLPFIFEHYQREIERFWRSVVGAPPQQAAMKVLILGGKGRLGGALARMWSTGHDLRTMSRPELDVADLQGLKSLLRSAAYDVLNCTGLTDVDRCETAREEAKIVNACAPGVMAEAAAAKGARLIHFSTDYVFDGAKTTPYIEEDVACPLGHYGKTKLAGEVAALAASPRHLAVRIAWAFGPDKPSFADTIIERALANDRVEAIANKTSCMTFTEDVARWLEPFLDGDLAGGLYHACNAGGCMARVWPACAGFRRAGGASPQDGTVEPIPLSALKAFLAPRPPHTAMSTAKLTTVTGAVPRPWQEALEEYLGTKLRVES